MRHGWLGAQSIKSNGFSGMALATILHDRADMIFSITQHKDKMMKAGKSMLMAALLLGFCNICHAAPSAAALIYISPRDYTLLTSVGVDQYQYSFNQGTAVEPVAIAALSPLFFDTQMCTSGDEAAVVIGIKPGMSYDPVVTLYYGEIEASIYSGSGRAVATYKGKVERNGSTDVYPERQIASVYEEAMQKIVQQIQADPVMQTLIEHGLPENETKMPCNMIMVMNGAEQ